MSCYQEVHCPDCESPKIIKLSCPLGAGKNATGTQRYLCQNISCETQIFKLDYSYKACKPGMTERIVEMAINGSGIRDTACVFNINKNTVINTLKKENTLASGKS